MQRFFKDFESLHQFSLSLDCQPDAIKCLYCLKNDQLVSHGIIYRQRSIEYAEKVGKRLFCSNRYGRRGCGRTFQLYVAQCVPFMQYGAAPLFVFIASLLANASLADAYQKATGQLEPRHAWRWLNKLMRRLTQYRRLLSVRAESASTQRPFNVRRLQILLPTLEALIAKLAHPPCASFQLLRQTAFI